MAKQIAYMVQGISLMLEFVIYKIAIYDQKSCD